MGHQITLDDLRKFTSTKWVDFAFASASNKRMMVSMRGAMRVLRGDEIVYEGQDASAAVRAYNEI